MQRGYCLTLFDTEKPEPAPMMKYFMGVQEKAPTTGILHWQSHFITTREMSLSNVNKKLREHGFKKFELQVRKGTFEQNEIYCSIGKGKNDTTGIIGTEFQYGEKPKPGRRNDIKEACEKVLEKGYIGAADNEIIVKYHRGLEKLLQVRKRPRNEEKKVYWLWGPTGTGKSQWANDTYPDLYTQSSDAGWFDGYRGQSAILIDDYDEGIFSLREILRLFDRYPYQVKVKGGMEWCMADTIIVTSHNKPQDYFPDTRWPELLRRITEIREYPIAGSSITPATSDKKTAQPDFLEQKDSLLIE